MLASIPEPAGPDALRVGGTAKTPFARARTGGSARRAAIISNLIANTNGVLGPMSMGKPLPNRLQAIAERISADRFAMTGNYEWQYTRDERRGNGNRGP